MIYSIGVRYRSETVYYTNAKNRHSALTKYLKHFHMTIISIDTDDVVKMVINVKTDAPQPVFYELLLLLVTQQF